MTCRNDDPLPRFGAPWTNSPGYITTRPRISALFSLSTKNPRMLVTRIQLPPVGQEKAPAPGPTPGSQAVVQLFSAFLHWYSSMSKTAIGTMRGLNGAHVGAHV